MNDIILPFRPTRLTLDYISKEMMNEGYILTESNYINASQILSCVCPNGHNWSISWGKWSIGRRCKYCSKHTLYLNDVKRKFNEEGFTLLNKHYINTSEKLRYICPKGHGHSILWANWNKGIRCPYCSGVARKTISSIRSKFSQEGYTLLEKEYKNGKQKLGFICPNRHYHSISWNGWKQGQRCKFCSNNISKWENEVKSFVDICGFEFISNDRSQIRKPPTRRPMELDLWFPNMKKAIECNGVYWHSRDKSISNDILKRELCDKRGINLLVINDEDWKEDKEKVKCKILSFLYR